MTFNDNTFQADGLGIFSKNLGKLFVKAVKKSATNALKNPIRFLENGAKVAAAVANRNPKAASSILPEKINFYHTGKGLYLGKIV